MLKSNSLIFNKCFSITDLRALPDDEASDNPKFKRGKRRRDQEEEEEEQVARPPKKTVLPANDNSDVELDNPPGIDEETEVPAAPASSSSSSSSSTAEMMTPPPSRSASQGNFILRRIFSLTFKYCLTGFNSCT